MDRQPPKRALQFLRWFCREDYLEEIEGDLIEVFEQQYEHDPRRARRSFTWQVIRYFRPDFIKSLNLEAMINPGMIKHNLKITWRGFLRNRTAFAINLIGLSTGLAAVLLIFLWVTDELRVDKFHTQGEQLYQVMHNLDMSQEVMTDHNTPVPLADYLLEELPEVENAVTVNDFFNWPSREGLFVVGDKRVAASGLISGKEFFQIFSYPLLQGDEEQVLTDKNGVVLSERMAIKLFGSTQDVVGRSVEWDYIGFDGLFQVTGVFADPPTHSTEQFDFLFHLDQLIEHDQWANSWSGSYGKTYVLLKKGTDVASFDAKIEQTIQEKHPRNTYSTLFAQIYSDRYLHGTYENGRPAGGRIAYVRLFSIIAVLLLLIACINFMNLSTAQATKKMKEIGVKKTLGASRKMLVMQYLGESMLLVLLSLILSGLLVAVLLPQFNAFTGKELQTNLDGNWVLSILGIALVTGLIAGSYPAFYLSNFNPLTVLKGKLHTSLGEFWARKGLVVFQFSLSILFIVGLLVIHQQIKLTQTQNLGYDRENVLKFQWKGELYDAWNGLGQDGKNNEQFYSLLDRLDHVPGIVSYSTMKGNILDNIIGQSGISWSGKEEERNFLFKSPIIGYNYIETMGMEMAAGRDFSGDRGDDYSKIILNEAAVKLMEIEDPVGKTIPMNGSSEIVGVVKDFHYGSLYNRIDPLIFRYQPNAENILIRIQAGREKETIEHLEALYADILPGLPFTYSFLDEDYQAQYEAENKVSVLSKYFAGLAIIISCLGLFGLATFTAERRMKEIGIRKVLGAGIFSIVRMLSSDFTRTVIVAILIALPIAYFLSSGWLQNFVIRIDLTWWYFLVPGLLVLLIAWATIGMQTLRAARLNPVECLQDE